MLQFESRHYLTGEELSKHELLFLIEEAEVMRRQRVSGAYKPFAGKTHALIFDKPSLRTRVRVPVGCQALGGHVMDIVSSQTKTGGAGRYDSRSSGNGRRCDASNIRARESRAHGDQSANSHHQWSVGSSSPMSGDRGPSHDLSALRTSRWFEAGVRR